ncbi:MAG: PASTA domain-containing protein [Clostridia bacterium]|nr:PASTA domain-containing protein [Clostridia bacterium]
MAQSERKESNSGRGTDGRANRVILGRTIALMCIFGAITFAPLLWKLWQIQIVDHDKYEGMAIEQQTRDMVVTAPRGTIYDDRGNIMAISSDVQNVVISPKDILAMQKDYQEKYAEKKPKDGHPEPTPEFVASGLSQILGIDQEKITKRMNNTKSQYEVIQWRVDDDVSAKVREFIVTNQLYPGVFLSPDTKRIYPYSSLAAQVIGWVNVNDNNKGAYGLEAYREDLLAGEAGRVVTSKNAAGTEMLSSYENYVDPVSGYNLHLTLDATIQSYCERVLSEGIDAYDVQKGGFAIVMNPKTGAILAMASSPDYDLNTPRDVTDPVLSEYLTSVQNDPSGSEEAYSKALADTQLKQWRNKALNDTYEPGSTFKIMVLAAALEEGVVNESNHFYCPGYAIVADRRISCSKHEGHGDQTLRQAVMNSCNPAFMAIGQKLGAEKFYQYLKDFGFLEKTGIDLQGEASNAGLIWAEDYFTGPYGIVSLATASFGQRFQVTPLQLVTAASASVNGGKLMKPYVLQSVTDMDGNVITDTQPTVVRQVVSEQTSELVRSILKSVVCDGGTGKNAYVAGYHIGGKTGTSETLIKGENIVSFMGVAPAEDPQVVVLLAYDVPTPAFPGANTTAKGYYISGGNMAAIKAGELIGDILDYLGVEKQYSADELAGADVTTPKVAGLSLKDAETLLQSKGLSFRAVGDGATVTGQIPAQGTVLPGNSQVVLYLGADVPTEQVAVPDVTGKGPEAVRNALAKVGLYMRASGATTGSIIADSQKIEAGAMVDPGAVIEVSFIDTQVRDYARGN